MGLTYVDSCIFIYLLEGTFEQQELIAAQMEQHVGDFAVSSLVRMECLVGPLRRADLLVHDRFERMLDRQRQLDIGPAQFRRATELRARFGLRTADALHLATAQLGACTGFWTADLRLAAASGGLAMHTS